MRRLGVAAVFAGAITTGSPVAHAAGQSLDQQISSNPLLAIGRCYGRFIAWRDELSSAMIETGTPPSPSAPARFEQIETAFAALVQRDRNLTLRLQPTFKESDFPTDVRDAFRVGLNETSARFAVDAYKTERMRIFAETSQTPNARMSDMEAHADAAFDDLGRPCDRFGKSLGWVKVLQKDPRKPAAVSKSAHAKPAKVRPSAKTRRPA